MPELPRFSISDVELQIPDDPSAIFCIDLHRIKQQP